MHTSNKKDRELEEMVRGMGCVMIISEVILKLEEAKEKYGDIDVYVDVDYGERQVDFDYDGFGVCHEEETESMPERVVI